MWSSPTRPAPGATSSRKRCRPSCCRSSGAPSSQAQPERGRDAVMQAQLEIPDTSVPIMKLSFSPRLCLLGGLAAAAIAAAGLALFSWNGSHTALGHTRTPERLVIAESQQPAYALLYVAEAKGY